MVEETCKEVASGVEEKGIKVVSGYEEVVEVVGMVVRYDSNSELLMRKYAESDTSCTVAVWKELNWV